MDDASHVRHAAARAVRIASWLSLLSSNGKALEDIADLVGHKGTAPNRVDRCARRAVATTYTELGQGAAARPGAA